MEKPKPKDKEQQWVMFVPLKHARGGAVMKRLSVSTEGSDEFVGLDFSVAGNSQYLAIGFP